MALAPIALIAAENFVSEAVVDYESELQRYQALLPGVWDIQHGERVLDVGCGRGQTTLLAARAAGSGRALGVDISPQMIADARAITRAEGPGNVEFECADAASYEFAPGEFDLVISRFGTMFFTNLLAGFSNIALALRGGGRLSMLVWREADLNEWTLALRYALDGEGSPLPPSTANAFSLGDRSFTAHVLTMAGFRKIAFREMSEPVYYGRDTAAALQWICGFANVKAALAQRSAPDRSRTLELLSEIIAEHDTGEGIWFGSRAWVVSARKA